MKKIITFSSIILITIILGIALMIGCKKENNDTQTDDSMKSFIQTMQEGAKVHNEAMSYCYEQLVILQPKENFLELVESLSIDFINFHPFFQSNTECAIKAANEAFKKSLNGKSLRTTLWFSEDEHLFSESQKNWLIQVYDVINNNVEIISKKLDEIEKLVLQKGTENDKYIVIVAIEIGKESTRYWCEHASEWMELTPGNFAKTGWFNWNECARDDLAAGVGGAIVGAFVDGIGAAPGFVGGAIAGSATNAVSQVWDHIFGK